MQKKTYEIGLRILDMRAIFCMVCFYGFIFLSGMSLYYEATYSKKECILFYDTARAFSMHFLSLYFLFKVSMQFVKVLCLEEKTLIRTQELLFEDFQRKLHDSHAHCIFP